MNDNDLKQAWRERPPTASTHRSGDRVERVWQAVQLELDAEQRTKLAEHAVHCSECALAWRLAASMVNYKEPASSARKLLWPAAAMLAVAIALSAWSISHVRRTAVTEWRTPDTVDIRSMLEDYGTLPRNAFVLQWSPGADGSVYDVEIGTLDLRMVDRATALEETEYRVSEARLADLKSGDVIAWRVVATAPTGERVLSVTFFNTLR